jgi:hypothetical protein
MLKKLYCYDFTSEEDRDQAALRFRSGDQTIRTMGIMSPDHLVAFFAQLLAESATFDRVLIQTHGSSGCIKFNDLSIFDTFLKSKFAGKNFHRLFPAYTRIYFDGCNVAADPFGWDFLEAVGSIFLRLSGGEVFGHTDPGYGITFDLPFIGGNPIGGHTIHGSQTLRTVYFGPGGIKVRQSAPPPRTPSAPTIQRFRRA